jgi:molecular chaperone DnaK
MTQSFGIDLGTTNSVISRLVDGRPVSIPIGGHPIVPSVVLYDGDRTVVGREARNLELLHPDRTIRSVKRRMGRPHLYQVGDRQLRPEDVSAEILRALKEGAARETGQDVRDVVITVPAYFDDAQRRATLEAGALAGLNVLRLLNEPTSASLLYEHLSTASAGPEIVLVYDLGGGTFDVSVLEVFQGVREVRATAGNTALGGDDVDDLLLHHFLDHLKRERGVDPREDPRAMARLRRLAEDTKIRLSSETRLQVSEEFLTRAGGKPAHLSMEITRRDLEVMIRPLLGATIDLARRAVDEARLGGQRLSRICLVGGSTRIPLVRELLEEAFDAEVHDEIDADLAVGLGASLQAGLLQGAPVDRILVDVAAHSLGIRAFSREDEHREEVDTFIPLIRRNTVLPARKARELYTMEDGQELVQVEVFQGESPRASQNARIGEFEFQLHEAPAQSPVRFEFSYDLNGVVRVSVSQPGAGNEKTVALSVSEASAPASFASPSGPAVPPRSAVERKARALLERLAGRDRDRLSDLLAVLDSAGDADRERAEDALLDLFLEIEAQE